MAMGLHLGGGEEIVIAGLVHSIADACGITGLIRSDATKPDGQQRRPLDTSRAHRALDRHATKSFSDGLRATVEWWQAQAV